jgi:hypothetical protein
MRSTIVGADGSVRCPRCGAVNSFTVKRTGKAKLVGLATVGVGMLAMPKRLKCNGCGINLKRSSPLPAATSAPRLRKPGWRCEKNDHLLDKRRSTCPIDGSPVEYRPARAEA